MSILFVDTNEKKLVELLGSKPDVVVKQLAVGDFIIAPKSGDAPYLILERKTYADLASSIVDGRYSNQKIRLLASEAQQRGYIIEGSYPTSARVGSLPRDTLDSSIMSMQLRDGFVVLNSQGLEHTARLLLKLQSKLPYEKVDRCTSEAYLSTIKTNKKDNMTPELCYNAQLTQIPGLSVNMAKHISEAYPNMSSLLTLLAEPDGWKRLSTISLGSRKLGKVLAERVRDYMLPSPSVLSATPETPETPVQPIVPVDVQVKTKVTIKVK